MEKTADRAEPGFRTRLLILTALCAAFGAYAAAVPFDPAALRAVPAQEQAFAGEPVEFVLDVPYAAPSDVFVNVALLPDGVTFSSAQKSSYVSKDDPSVIGTRYRFWLTPRAAGTLALSPVRLIYRGEEYRVAAEPVQVYLTPALLEPELTIVFADSPCTDAAAAAEAGEPVRYTVAVRYAARVVSYSWGMPEDALFAETARYPFAGETGAEAPFSPDAQPLCEFSWTPLKAGASSLPPFTAEAVSYAGERMTLLLPEHRVQVNAPAAAAPENPGAETYFSQAFDEQYADDGAGAAGAEAVSAAQVRRIIELRRAERNALPFSHARAERAAFEQEAGLAVGVREPSAALLRAAKENGINTAMESMACAPMETIEKILEWLDVYLCDVKHMNGEKPKEFTGRDNALMLSNIRKIAESGKTHLVIRVPVIPTRESFLEGLSWKLAAMMARA